MDFQKTSYPTRILFVCMGNICRSPAAEAIFRARVREAGLADRIACDSAGTIGYHSGEPADARMRAAAEGRGYTLDSLARQVRPDDLERFDLLVAMDRDNHAALQSLRNGRTDGARIVMMCDFARGHDEEEVPDPYYGGEQGFEKVLDLLEDACEGLLEEVRKY